MSENPLDRPVGAGDLYLLMEEGVLGREALDRALVDGGLTPSSSSWTTFFERLFLMLGSLLTLSGIVYFFAYNWDRLGRFEKFGLIEAAIAGAAAIAWFKGLDRLTGKTALFSAAVLVGPLLAVYGQVYQTGADAHGLFLTWLLLIAGWAAAASFAPFWLLVIALADTWFILYWNQVLEGRIEGRVTTLFLILALANIFFWLVWEEMSRRGHSWMSPRWYAGGIAAAVVTWLTLFGVTAVFDKRISLWLYPPLAGAIMLYTFFRCRDLFILAASFLSVIVISASLFVRIAGTDEGSFLFIGLLVAGLTAGAAVLLRKIRRQWEEPK